MSRVFLLEFEKATSLVSFCYPEFANVSYFVLLKFETATSKNSDSWTWRIWLVLEMLRA
jgi:hypothetical protein